MLRSQNPLHWLMLAWLALAPALSAAHAGQHDLDHTSADVTCVLCHLGDRDDDIFAPDSDFLLPRMVLLPEPLVADELVTEPTKLGFAIRGPPLPR